MSNELPVILVYSPYFRGFYLGEIAESLFKASLSERFNIIHVRTGGFNDFSLPLAIDRVDGVISIMNAVSTSLLDEIIAREIPVVSIGHDYFPLHVEYVGGDNRSGIYQSFGHLIHKGCKRIGFAGDFNITDMRIRCEAYKESHKKFNVKFDERRIFSVSNPDFQGGIKTAQMFLEREKNCDAIIFAADKMALGFTSYCQKRGIQVPKDVMITGYDNTHMGRNSIPAISSVDQNIPQLVSYAVSRVLSRIRGDKYCDQLQLINPKFIARHSTNDTHSDGYDDDPDDSYFTDTHYSIPGENPIAMAADGLASLQSYSNLYGPFMDWALLADIDGRVNFFEKVNIVGVYNGGSRSSDIYASDVCTCNEFPLSGLKIRCDDPYVINLLPVESEPQVYKSLVSQSNLTQVKSVESLVEYNCFLELMSTFVAARFTVDTSDSTSKEAERWEDEQSGFQWYWNLNSNQVDWGSKILEMLGYSSSAEKHIYSKMGFFERIHPEDIKYVRSLIKSHMDSGQTFTCQFRLGSKEEGYIWVKAKGKSIKDSNGNITQLAGRISEIPHQKLIKSTSEIYLVQHDQLTGLPSRRFIQDDLKEKIKKYPEGPIAIMWLNLNRFRQINENYGHAMGDQVLRSTVEHVRKSLGCRHLFSRFGSDEFVIVARVRNAEHAEALGKRVLKAVETPFMVSESESITVTGGMGVSLFPETSSMLDDLFKQADVASSQAKRQKSIGPVLYTPEIARGMTNKVTLESALRDAIDKEEIYLVFQPQIDIQTKQLVGVESLCRWRSPQLGDVAPEQFINVAEETGIIHKLGDWILDSSLRALKNWEEHGISNIKMSVNVSANQLMDPGLIKRFRNKLEALNVCQSKIAIEVTESAAIDDLQKTCELLKEFSALGVQISLDDFGTGFSSLSLLKDLPLEWVKIDKSFIDNIEESPADQSIVRSICMLGHSLGYKVVVEGVESHNQLNIVKELGCDVVQGYVYSKALSSGDIIAHYAGAVRSA